jgi:hypothetical protein
MDWLTENGLWILFGAGFLWMHLKMHGGHRGGHGGCGGSHGEDGRHSHDREDGEGRE